MGPESAASARSPAESAPPEVHNGQRSRVHRLGRRPTNPDADPLVDAYVSCLDAADAIGRALERRHGDSPSAVEAAVQDGLFAARVATAAMKYHLIQAAGTVQQPGDRPTDRSFP